MIEFHILGSTTLRGEDGDFDHSFLAGPKRLALLTYLTLARPRGYQRRDKLVALFWRERGQKSARNALSNMLYHIRDALGEDAIINRGTEEVSINPEKIWCDAIAFEKALEEDEAHKALDFYHGDLLPGFHVADVSNEFQSWLDEQRLRLRKRAAEAAWKLAEKANQSGNLASARRWAQKALSYSEFSEEAYHRLITLLHRVGDRSGALKAYDEFAKRMMDEWEMEPSPEMHALVKTIRDSRPEHSPGSREDMREKESKHSVVVLPFESVGTQTPSAFASGIHGDVLTNLSNVGDIRVISRTSVQKFANSPKTVREIGNELHANWLLEGDVQEDNGQVQLNVRLINAKTDSQLWSQDYRRKLTAGNLFQIQGEITKEIAAALEAEFTPAEKKRVEHRPTENLDAYRLYMQGLSLVEQRTEKGTRRALEYFNQAIARDPAFALALTGRAQALLAIYGYGFEVTEDVLIEAEKAIHQALDQDEDLAEAHAALGVLHSERHRGPEAVQELKQSIELRPGYADAHNKLSWVYQLIGDKEGALKSANKAVDLDPFSPEAVINLSFSYLANGELEKALLQARRVCELQPEWTSGPFYIGLILYHQGQFKEAKSHLQGIEVPWASEGPRVVLALCQIATGDREKARNHLAFFKNTEDYFAAGLVQAALGETNLALDALEKVEPWRAWPTHVMHYLFPEIIHELKEHLRFQTIFDEMIQYWGMELIPATSGSVDSKALSIAVLPFVSLGKEEEELFVNGIHDDLLTRLSSISGLEVTSRTSVMRYKKTGKLLTQISKELGVNWIVEGSVQQINNQVQVRVRLVNTGTDRQRWAKNFQRALTVANIFQIQSEITREIADTLKTQLSPEEKKQVEQHPTESLAAYRLYMQGWSWMEQRTEKGYRRALDYFNQAIEKDRNYTLANVGRGFALTGLNDYGFEEPESVLPEAEAIILRALQQNEDLPEVHAAHANLHSVRHEGAKTIQELKRAVELRPGYSDAHNWLSWNYQLLGKSQKALIHAKKAVNLDPFSPEAVSNLSLSYLTNKRYEQAVDAALRTRELLPTWTTGLFYEGVTYFHMGKYTKAISVLDELSVPWADEGPRITVALACMATGDEVSTRNHLAYFEDVNDHFAMAMTHAALEETELALTSLEQIERWEHWPTLALHHFYPDVFEPIKNEPRFKKVKQKMKRSRA